MFETKYTLRLANGSIVAGAIHGSGGLVGGGMHNKHRIARAIFRAGEGRDTGLFTPKPGHCRMYPNVTAADAGEPIDVDLRGATLLETYVTHDEQMEAGARVKPLDPLSLAAFEAMREVLSSHGLVICSASDTQYPKLDRDLDKVLREMARNSVQSVIAVQDEQALVSEERFLIAANAGNAVRP